MSGRRSAATATGFWRKAALPWAARQLSTRGGHWHQRIDLVVLLDSVELNDLDAYRAIVRAMPEGEKACGFISGVKELLHWPRHELFAFKQDTTDYYGKLDAFLPVITDRDVVEAIRIGASTLLHLLTHS